jgi:glycerol dehydrogenase-like iron-containing ADH family enzyme
MGSVVDALDEIQAGSEAGVRALVLAHRWGGTTFHDSGWNPRHIEGVEHFLFYNLERITGRHFIHGQPVGLGIVAGSVIQDNEPERMVAAIARAGVDIRPEAMGVTWDDVAEAMRTLPTYVRDAGLWFSVADAGPVTDDHVARTRELVEGAFVGSSEDAAPVAGS